MGNTPSKGFCSSSKDATLGAVSVGGASPPHLYPLFLSVPHVHKTIFRPAIDYLSSNDGHTWYAKALGPASSFLVRQSPVPSKLPERQRALAPRLVKIRAGPEVLRMSSNLVETWPDYWGTLPPKDFDLAQTVRPGEKFPSAAAGGASPLSLPSLSKCPPRSQNELSLGARSIFELEPSHLTGKCPGSCQFFFGKAACSSLKTAQTPKGAALPTCKNSCPARSAQNELKFGGDLPTLLGNTPSKGF